MKQLINHGHIYVNNQKVTAPSRIIKLGDRIKIKGFMERLDTSRAATTAPGTLSDDRANPKHTPIPAFLKHVKNHRYTMLLRRFEDQGHLASDPESGGGGTIARAEKDSGKKPN